MIKTMEGKPTQEQQDRLFDVIEEMQRAEDLSAMKPLIREYLTIIKEGCGIELSPDVTSLYAEMERRNFLLRLENVRKIFEGILLRQPINLGTDEDKYANAVVATNDAIAIAFAEGDAPGPIRTLVGFDVRSAIGFDPAGIKMDKIDSSEDEFDLRNTALRAAYCRHVSGQLSPEDIRYLIFRVPRGIFPEELLTEEEQKKAGKFIFRGARVMHNKEQS